MIHIIRKAILMVSLGVFSFASSGLFAMPKVPSAREIKSEKEQYYAAELARIKARDASRDARAAQKLGFPYLLARYGGRSATLHIPGLDESETGIAKQRCPLLILEGMGDVIYGSSHMAYRKAMTDYASTFNKINFRVCGQ